ncbi:hypothetical protein BN1723_012446 [Verticillium longisporum]|uniref:Glycosyl hydrolase family 32 N-terminal domain-containing protein n=1 Tax=Verticillium longisporum TaxID=100787 RepID=A0A0G4LID4_VERLO|nr:hypothetical protein BN1723_012446 [Verticillium longisporum]
MWRRGERKLPWSWPISIRGLGSQVFLAGRACKQRRLAISRLLSPIMVAASKILCSGALFSSLAAARWIVPGGRWIDTDGGLVNAHAGGVTREEETGKFFWFGEYKIQGQEEGGGVSVYSSDDLVTWENHGLALIPEEGHEFISPEMIIQRPKVVYSRETQQYHMWWHADDSKYSLLLQGLAVSPNITGPYTFVDATAPLGNWSQDFGLFTDNYGNGRSYALYSNGDRREGRDVYLSVFNENITEVEEVTFRFNKRTRVTTRS